MNEVYVRADVETDGPIPGIHSMLSLQRFSIVCDPWGRFLTCPVSAPV
jgi:hypothetical protein